MAIVVKKPKLSLLERLYIFEALKGMWLTFRHFLRNLLNPENLPTLNYPEQKRKLLPNFRGLPRLLKKENGELKCTACKLCAVACPAHCIDIEMARNAEGKPMKSPSVYDLDSSRCIFCGFCVEACPFDAIDMNSGLYELASTSLEGAVLNKEELSSSGNPSEENIKAKQTEES